MALNNISDKSEPYQSATQILLETAQTPPHDDEVNPKNTLPPEQVVERILLRHLSEILKTPEAKDKLDVVALQRELAEAFAPTQAEPADEVRAVPSRKVVDVFGNELEIPPKPRRQYALSVRDFGRKLNPEEFIDEVWADYTADSWLYAEQLKDIDLPLYDAIRRRAKTGGRPATEYFKELGILTQQDTVYPPDGLEEQAAVWRAYRQQRKEIKPTLRTASDLRADLQTDNTRDMTG